MLFSVTLHCANIHNKDQCIVEYIRYVVAVTLLHESAFMFIILTCFLYVFFFYFTVVVVIVVVFLFAFHYYYCYYYFLLFVFRILILNSFCTQVKLKSFEIIFFDRHHISFQFPPFFFSFFFNLKIFLL